MQNRPEPRPFDVEYLDNPTQSELRELAVANTPAVQVTQSGSLNKVSRNKARMAKYTYVIAPESAAGDVLHEQPRFHGTEEPAADLETGGQARTSLGV